MNEHAENSNQKDDEFVISTYLRRYSRYKLLFVISLAGFLLLAGLYLYWKTPLYRIQASLVIKDEKKGESISLTLKELDFLDEQKIIDNEAEIIKSESIVGKVVRSMNLNISYFTEDNLIRKSPLFDDSPVEFRVVTPGMELFKDPIQLSLLDQNTFSFSSGKQVYGYGDTIEMGDQAKVIVFRKKNLADPAIKKIKVVISDAEETTQQLRAAINASAPSKNSSVLYVSMLYPSREKGVAILKEIIGEYDKSNLEEKRSQTDSIVALIEGRLSLIGDQVKDLEGKEQSLKTNRSITFLGDDARSYLDQAMSNDKERTEAEIQLDNIKKVEDYLSTNSAITSPPNTSLNDPVLTNMVVKLNELELEKSALLKRTGPKHPSVLAVTRQVEDIRKSLTDNIKLQRSSLEKKIGLIRQNQSRINSSISQVPSSERNLLELLREKNIRENIYTYLLQKREEASLSDATVFSKMRWVDQPFSSIKPVKPRKPVILAAALLAGLLFPVIIISFRESFRSKIHSSSIKSRLNFPVIGYVPSIRKFEYQSYSDSSNIIAEQFRGIRTSIANSIISSPSASRVILVTSPGVYDGKSFISLNIASSFASVHKKTVLVDFDLRKSKLSEIMGQQAQSDFTEQLATGNFMVDTLARPVGNSSYLYLVADQQEYEDSTNLIDKADLHTFFETLRSNFEVIVINTPPLTYFSDAFLLNPYADTGILVLRDRFTSLKQISAVQQMVGQHKLNNPLVVYNDIPVSELFERNQLKGYRSYQYS